MKSNKTSIILTLTKDQKKLLMNMLLSSLAMDQDAPEVAPPNAVKDWKEIIKQIKGGSKS